MEADLAYMLQPSRIYIGDNINVFGRGKSLLCSIAFPFPTGVAVGL